MDLGIRGKVAFITGGSRGWGKAAAISLAKEVGFKHTDTWWLSLSTQQGGSAVSTIDGEITETKQKQQYMGEYQRPDLPGRKFEPTFIFQK